MEKIEVLEEFKGRKKVQHVTGGDMEHWVTSSVPFDVEVKDLDVQIIFPTKDKRGRVLLLFDSNMKTVGGYYLVGEEILSKPLKWLMDKSNFEYIVAREIYVSVLDKWLHIISLNKKQEHETQVNTTESSIKESEKINEPLVSNNLNNTNTETTEPWYEKWLAFIFIALFILFCYFQCVSLGDDHNDSGIESTIKTHGPRYD